jgi:predicted regulator of amino acid metabolism with ACT domain
MKIVEVEVRLPYDKRGATLRQIISKVRGRIRDIHFSPPDVRGMSEVRMELVEDNPTSLIKELKKIVRGGTLGLRVLTEA